MPSAIAPVPSATTARRAAMRSPAPVVASASAGVVDTRSTGIP
jgi:hypothetical protein